MLKRGFRDPKTGLPRDEVHPGHEISPHYSLDIPVFLVEGEPQAIVRRIQEEAGKYRSCGKKVGILSSEESKGAILRLCGRGKVSRLET